MHLKRTLTEALIGVGFALIGILFVYGIAYLMGVPITIFAGIIIGVAVGIPSGLLGMLLGSKTFTK